MGALNLSRPAYIAYVAYVVMALVILLPFNIKGTLDPNDELEISNKYVFTQRLILVLVMAVPFALSVYSINCFMVGNCVAWSYLHAILAVAWVLIFLLGTVISSHTQVQVFRGVVSW